MKGRGVDEMKSNQRIHLSAHGSRENKRGNEKHRRIVFMDWDEHRLTVCPDHCISGKEGMGGVKQQIKCE